MTELWNMVFPGRQIDFTTAKPRVTAEEGDGGYDLPKLSGGERVALYLLARVVEAKAGLVIVDEPEIHLHRKLAQQFWDLIEDFREDCRFVYLTHDVGFALSRRNSRLVILREKNKPVLLPEGDQIPSDVLHALLGTSTLSTAVKRIVFCEGKEARTSDYSVYSAWFDGHDTVVCPVNDCDSVINHTAVFVSQKPIIGLDAIGIIDRDYRPEAFLTALPPNITALVVHEMEGLFCTRDVFSAVAKHQGIPGNEIQEKYDTAMDAAKRQFTGVFKNKQALTRAKQLMEYELKALTNPLNPTADALAGQRQFCIAFDANQWNKHPATVYQDELATIDDALSGANEAFLRTFPSKTILGQLQTALGIDKKTYVRLVAKGLSPSNDDVATFKRLSIELEAALRPLLPDRRA